MPIATGQQILAADVFPIAAGVGDIPECFNDTENGSNATSYEKVKETSLARSGTLRIKFDVRGHLSGTGYGKIYRNGAAVGTERSNNTDTWVTFSEDIAGWSAADLCQLYTKHSAGGGAYSKVRNFRIYVNVPVNNVATVD